MTDIGDIYRLQNILCHLEMVSDQLYDVPKQLLRPVEEELLDNARNSAQELRNLILRRKLEMLDRMKEEKR